MEKKKNYLDRVIISNRLIHDCNAISRIEIIVDPNIGLAGIDVSEAKDGSILMSYDSNDDYVNESIPMVSWTLRIVSADKIYLKGNWSHTFVDFIRLISIQGLENLDTSEVTNMMGLFNNCTNLESIDLSTWNTSNVTNMSLMFRGCCNLKELYLGTASPSNVSDMFAGCDSLEEIHVPLSPLHDEIYKNNMDVVFDPIEGSRMQDAIRADGTVTESFKRTKERKM